jgi:hypothetical protein
MEITIKYSESTTFYSISTDISNTVPLDNFKIIKEIATKECGKKGEIDSGEYIGMVDEHLILKNKKSKVLLFIPVSR